MSGAEEIVVGAVSFGPAPSSCEDAMAASIVHLLGRLAEVEAERDFYKAASSKLMSKHPHNGRRKN